MGPFEYQAAQMAISSRPNPRVDSFVPEAPVNAVVGTSAQIANELGRRVSAVMVKAHQVRLSLRMRPKRGSREVIDADRADADRAGVGIRANWTHHQFVLADPSE
jgi:hypothetical protein